MLQIAFLAQDYGLAVEGGQNTVRRVGFGSKCQPPSDGSGNQGVIGVNRSLRPKEKQIAATKFLIDIKEWSS